MNDIITTIELGRKDGFTLIFEALPEYEPIQGQFAYDTEEKTRQAENEAIDKINSGDWVYFCAKVTASKDGIELGNDYLGCCIYNSFQDFVDQNDYIDDMKNIALNEAKRTLKQLTKGIK